MAKVNNFSASYSRGGSTAHFFVKTVTTGFGRRGKLHETPFKDTPFFEDLGRKGREFTIEAYVMPAKMSSSGFTPLNSASANYLDLRNNLVDIIENETGAGIFMHPTMGQMLVVPTDCSTTFDNSQGRIETFSITFVEAGKREGSDSTEFRKQTERKAAKAMEGSKKAFIASDPHLTSRGEEETKLSETMFGGMIDGLKDYVKEMKKNIKSSSTFTAYTTISDNLSDIQEGANEIANFSKSIDDFALELQMQPEKLINSIGSIYFSVATIMSAYSKVTTNPLEGFKNMFSMFKKFKGKASDNRKSLKNYRKRTTKISPIARVKIVEEASNTMIMSLSVVESTIYILNIDFESSKQMIEVKEQLNEMFNEAVLFIGDGDVTTSYNDMLELQASINQYLDDAVLELPSVKTIRTRKVMPAVVIAYNQYEDANKVGEIIERNGISDPNSTPIGDLEVVV